MGAAFARGFTKGILKYQAEENEIRTTFNMRIDKLLTPLIAQEKFLQEMKTVESMMTSETKKKLSNDLGALNSKINELKAKKKALLDVQFGSEIDLSSHQIDYVNPDVKKNYYMTTNNLSRLEKAFVDQKVITGATNLGTMDVHHSSGANPANLPPSTTADPNPPK